MTPTPRGRPTPINLRFDAGDARLEVVASSVDHLVGQVLTLDFDRVLIGRDPMAAVALPDARLSRRHAELRRDKTGYQLVDLSSTNGSWVNGERCERQQLKHGDSIRLGSTIFVFVEATLRQTTPEVSHQHEITSAELCVANNLTYLHAAFADGILTTEELEEVLRDCRQSVMRLVEKARVTARGRPEDSTPTPVVERNIKRRS